MEMVCTSSLDQEKITLSDYACGLVISDKRRYLEKISAIEVDPYCISFAELSKDILPPVQCTDIFNYLVLGKSFCTSQRFKAFKSLYTARTISKVVLKRGGDAHSDNPSYHFID